MHPSRRRKKRPNYGIRTVEVLRGPHGFGFTISGQQPCILSCIVAGSPADHAGLRAGDFLISVNGTSVSKLAHDSVVSLIGNCPGPIRMTIAENYYSDSSEEELDCQRMVSARSKPKYNKPRTHHRGATGKQKPEDGGATAGPPQPMEEEAGPIEYKALVGYLGTIEMPKPVLPASRLQTVCVCIKKLRQEKRTPTAVLMTIFPTCLTLKNASNHILAIYPTNRVVYVGSTADRESRYFGLVTSAVSSSNDNSSNQQIQQQPQQKRFGDINQWPNKDDNRKFNNAENAAAAGVELCHQYQPNNNNNVDISNSCHVFMTDPKIVDHAIHVKKAESFKINCTSDLITGNCLEFPINALYIVNLVQNMYKLQSSGTNENEAGGGGAMAGGVAGGAPVVANSPQPSASSNSDSGIGFRDDCGNISDRILVVEFPAQQRQPQQALAAMGAASPPPLPQQAEALNNFELNNIRSKNLDIKLPNNLSSIKHMNNLNNIRATCESSINIKNVLQDDSNNCLQHKQNNDSRLTCRAMPAPIKMLLSSSSPPHSITTTSSEDNTNYSERPVDVVLLPPSLDLPLPSPSKKYHHATDHFHHHYHHHHQQQQQQRHHHQQQHHRSMDSISVHSSKSAENLKSSSNVGGVFKTPRAVCFDGWRKKKQQQHQQQQQQQQQPKQLQEQNQQKLVNSCDNLDKFMDYKLSPKVYGLSKPHHDHQQIDSCEELNNLDSVEKYGYGSLQELCSWTGRSTMRNGAQSEPDVRIQRRDGKDSESEENGPANKCNHSEGPAGWATSFEKLLDDPLGLHTFAEFLKKEFSAENIYFWTACERYRRLPESGPERGAEAQRIYQQHLCVGAPEPVNVDAQGRQCTEQSLREARTGLFDQAQKQIFNLMKFDSYPRFLKSDLYRQCLNGDDFAHGSHLQLDAGLLLQPPNSSGGGTPLSKLKKSLSNAEDRRRKSLLPWHRKNRSKSKDRGEIEYNNGHQQHHHHHNNNNHHSRKNDALMASNESVDGVGCGGKSAGSDIHSSKSSLTSLDLACTSNHDFVRGTTPDELSAAGKTALCRVILSNGSTTVVQIKQEETIHQLVSRLLEKRGLLYSSFEVFTDKQSKALDVNEASTKLTGCEVTVEQRVVFKMDLPNKKVISVKSKYTKIIVDVLGPILQKYNYSLDQARVTDHQDQIVDVYMPVTAIDGARLRVHYGEAPPIIKVNNMRVANTKLEEITNQVFVGILQEKADSAAFLKPATKSDRGSVKSEDWGSEHSSGIFGRFLRRDSGLHEAKKKKSLIPRAKAYSAEDVAAAGVPGVQSQPPPQLPPPTQERQVKKPLIAKLKTGVNKLQVTACSESDELVEGLTRAQRSRLEDQRGTEINFELPDFLKDKQRKQQPQEAANVAARFYLERGAAAAGGGEDSRAVSSRLTPPKSLKLESRCNYENRNIKDNMNNLGSGGGSNSPNKLNNLRIYSPNKLHEDSPTKSAGAVAVTTTPKSGEPPPLPPKPKIIPIKPPNWGQNGFYRKDVVLQPPSEKSKTLYLEQSSSSFV